MHAGNLKTSTRLQRTLESIKDGFEHTTMQIHKFTGSLCVHSDISALRVNGINVQSRPAGRTPEGNNVHAYWIATI